MLRRTRVTPVHIEKILLWLFFAAVLYVAIRALIVTPATSDLIVSTLILLIAIADPAMAFLVPRRHLEGHVLLVTLVDVAIVSALYFLTGGTRGGAHFLLYIVIALAATRLRLEFALAVATLSGLVFSTNLIVPLTSPELQKDVGILTTDLLSYYAIVFIFHFFVTGQREAELRRSREAALAEASRLMDQQELLARLSREITNASSFDDILHIVLQTVRPFVPFSGGSIALIDIHQRLYVAASDPPADEAVRALRLPVGEGISGWIAQHQEPFYSEDLDSETRVAPSYRHVGGNAQVKSFLGVPLVTGGHCSGVLQIESAAANAFSQEHRRLLETVAAQVAGAIENARLLDERREFSRQLLEVYETANEMTSHFDLDFILESVARRAARLLNSRYSAAATLDAHGQIANFVTTGLTEAERRLVGSPPQGVGLLGLVFHGQAPIRLEDISKHPESVGFPPHHPYMRTLLASPLISRGETHGALYVSEKLDGQPFSDKDEELLMLLTAGASAAVSNARLYTQLRKNIEQLYALHQIGQAISSSLSWEDVIHDFNRDAKRLCGAEAAVLSQWNAEANRLTSVNSEGEQRLLEVRERAELYRQLAEAARTGQPATLSLAPNSGNSSRLYGFVAPLNVRGKVVGLAEIYSRSAAVIAPESSSLFLTLVAQLAVSMENGRLYSELQKREQQLRNFVVRLFQAQDDERRRMAYDIHDGLAQLIISADMHLSNFASILRGDPDLASPDFEKGLKRLKSALAEVRRVVSELRPSTLDDFGLVNTLKRYVEELAAEQGWESSFTENLGEMRLDPTLETGAFRIVQESLNNTRKHSGTRRIEVKLEHQGDHLHIRVQDWGKGFDLDVARHLDGHFGLSGMEERCRLLGGWCHVESVPGEGTTVKIELPCYTAIPSPKG
jgi:signal transduction histidine kinase